MTLLRALNTTIGKKVVMAITGLLLGGFLVVHLAGNVLMYVGPDAYNGYAHALHSQEWFVMSAETGLAVLFFAHLYLAIRTTLDNRNARNKGYTDKETKQGGWIMQKTSATMFWSGAVLLLFIIWHLIDFSFEGREAIAPLGGGFEYDDHEPFAKALLLLQNPLSAGIYLVGCAMLTFHLIHGFQSSFQTLGIAHPFWSKWLRVLGIVVAIVFGVGFASFVVWAQIMPVPEPSAVTPH